MRNLNDILNLESSNSPSFHLDIAVESEMDGNSSYASDHLIEQLFDEFSQLPVCKETYDTLFRFTGLPTVEGESNESPIISDIRTESLTFSNPKRFNDPMDPILREWLNLKRKEVSDKTTEKIYKMTLHALGHLRICCLSNGMPQKCLFWKNSSKTPILNCSSLMWAHYANSHKGICIQYEITPDSIKQHNDESHVLRIGNIRYKNRKAMSDYITLDNALLAKSNSWEYEKEVRLMYYAKDIKSWSENKKDKDFVTLPGFRIKAVYMGLKSMIQIKPR